MTVDGPGQPKFEPPESRWSRSLQASALARSTFSTFTWIAPSPPTCRKNELSRNRERLQGKELEATSHQSDSHSEAWSTKAPSQTESHRRIVNFQGITTRRVQHGSRKLQTESTATLDRAAGTHRRQRAIIARVESIARGCEFCAALLEAGTAHWLKDQRAKDICVRLVFSLQETLWQALASPNPPYRKTILEPNEHITRQMARYTESSPANPKTEVNGEPTRWVMTQPRGGALQTNSTFNKEAARYRSCQADIVTHRPGSLESGLFRVTVRPFP